MKTSKLPISKLTLLLAGLTSVIIGLIQVILIEAVFIPSSTKRIENSQKGLVEAVSSIVEIPMRNGDLDLGKMWLSRIRGLPEVEKTEIVQSRIPQPATVSNVQQHVIYFDPEKPSQVLGTVQVAFNDSELKATRFEFYLVAFAGMAVTTIILLFLFQYGRRLFLSDLEDFSKAISDSAQTELVLNSRVQEIDLLYNEYLRKRASELALIESSAKAIALSQIATQVAHDIRSPLTAISMLEKDLNELPEKKRMLLKMAATRIRDIADHLLAKHKLVMRADDSVHLLSSLIDRLLTEKRLQYRSRPGANIELSVDETSYGAFAKVEAQAFLRVLSNLIDNSVEAIGESGRVEIRLSATPSTVQIMIQDTGVGMPPEILARVGQKGESFGKSNGSGLGLHNAKSTLKSWGGRIEIASELGTGTVVRILLPRDRRPIWFSDRITIAPHARIVVVDDDSSIHQVWDQRFEIAGIKNPILHLSSPQELQDFVSMEKGTFENTLFLIDYEFLGFEETGIDLCEKLNIAKQAVLVTNHFDEAALRHSCEKLRMKMIPKTLASSIPFDIRIAN